LGPGLPVAAGRGSDGVLEISTGWSGLTLYAAQSRGCRVTTATISRRQYELARHRLAVAGLSERVEVWLTDYRDLAGQYDKLVSIEMVEAVGADHLTTYFASVAACSSPKAPCCCKPSPFAD